jgi:hypothetical protein
VDGVAGTAKVVASDNKYRPPEKLLPGFGDLGIK